MWVEVVPAPAPWRPSECMWLLVESLSDNNDFPEESDTVDGDDDDDDDDDAGTTVRALAISKVRYEE